MLRKKQEVFSQPRDNLGQAPCPSQLWVVACYNCLLTNSTDREAGIETTNLTLLKAMSNSKKQKNNEYKFRFTTLYQGKP